MKQYRRPLRHLVAEGALVVAVILAGVALRATRLDETPFWVDEAESSINALTILQHGYPTDQYLGLPIFENTLVKPWPGNPEYEFKDLSYSDRGVAIYHGWLPLYSIAASFAWNGIQPDHTGNTAPSHTLAEMKRLTRAARAPSVIFGALFLALCYIAGTLLYGRDAGWAALLVASFAAFDIDASRQARYYSAVIALSTGTLIMLWLILKKGRAGHYVAAALVFLLLFFTHLVTFAAAGIVFLLSAPLIFFRQKRPFAKLIVFLAILLTGVGSWVAASGFLSGFGYIPPARSYLSLPGDFFTYPIGQRAHICIFGAFLLLIGLAYAGRLRVPARIARPLRESSPAVALLALWVLVSYTAFFLFIPAVSFDSTRMKFPYWGASLLLAAIFCAVAARVAAPRFSVVLAPAIAYGLATITGVALFHPSPPGRSWSRMTSLISYLEHTGFAPDARLYAIPNSHLILSVYTGLPFQSIYPVRKSYLDSYPGEIVYFDLDEFGLDRRNELLAPARLQEAAHRAGETLAGDAALTLSRSLRTEPYRRSMNLRIGGTPRCAAALMPAYATKLLNSQSGEDSFVLSEMVSRVPILRGHRVSNWRDWIGVFVYRFVDPAYRIGPGLNYRSRLGGSRGDILTEAGWVVYHSPPDRDRSAAVTYRLLP